MGQVINTARFRRQELSPAPFDGKIRVNFPYPDTTTPHRPTPLLRASWNNARQVLASRREGFAARYRPPVLALLARAERTLLLAGSCGLELLAHLDLPEKTLARLHVFAYGAVARRRPACEIRQVRGRRDWVANALSRIPLGPSDDWVAGGHLDYLNDPEVLSLCSAFLIELREPGR